ncbi:hypothetical protein SAMN04488542_13132 [Fontibacillus panacisegetis]|uniref:Uncharacterized protein n=1 Tax=Fontibacillus panacisegetis TaxID=670482 RepID=A0A1G7SPR2_9BACL|nr:hypothetical protein [Fontibacillus panacisegetis]SDG25033.1 hypothetical protein SAMN04488542_13132 [Fontibacillus panacisegetis]
MDYSIPIKAKNEMLKYYDYDVHNEIRGTQLQSVTLNQLDSFIARLAESVVINGEIYENTFHSHENEQKIIEVRPYKYYDDSINEEPIIERITQIIKTDYSTHIPPHFMLEVYYVVEQPEKIYSLEADTSLDIITILLDNQRIIDGNTYGFIYSCLDLSKRKVYLFVE